MDAVTTDDIILAGLAAASRGKLKVVGTFLRSSVIEYDARIMSTSPFCSMASRCLLGASLNSISASV